jgi:transcriptional regulator with XRE-family HTH domain
LTQETFAALIQVDLSTLRNWEQGRREPTHLFLTHLLRRFADPAESDHFKESLDSARGGHLRAATVMAWCAAIDRIHRAIEQIGFDKFNAMSAQMTAQQKGSI